MALLPLAWTLLTVSLWTAGSSQILLREPIKNLYPKISSQETVDCDCGNTSCDSVYWFRTVPSTNSLQFLGKCNNADRVIYGPKVETTRIKLSKKGSVSFVLRIINVQEEDRGIYSCVIRDKANTETWKPGSFLQPGVTPPTPPPLTKAPVNPGCRCSNKKKKKTPSHDVSACDSLLLWPLVGLAVFLAVTLMCTLYYFSRLPKKFHHHFVKIRQMP